MASSLTGSKHKLLRGTCPDEQCQTTLFFPSHDSSIECTNCGQRHNKSRIKDVAVVTDHKVALHNVLKSLLLGKVKPKKGTDSVKVLGVSNFQCKSLSPLLTKYGMDKVTGRAKLLVEMQPPRDSFDCSILGDRAFRIEKEHVEVMGYGRERTGSMLYLSDTLEAIRKFNGDEECLLPIHADGDGHCLVHAISRALIGRELFWHALRENLKTHLETKLDQYKALFADFVESSEWQNIIDECDPLFLPTDGDAMGLRNIHIFGLANILKRPIILLDSLRGIQSSGDYSGLFLPAMNTVEDCTKGGQLNRPICIAWSSAGRNHYIALVGVKGLPLPRLPGWMIPKVWGVPQEQADLYTQLEADGSIVIGGDKCLTDKYILRLVDAMEEVYQESHKVSTSLVADVNQFIFKTTGYVSAMPEVVLEHTQRAVASRQLYRCLTCEALVEWMADPEWFRSGGQLYKLAVNTHKKLDPTKLYSFPLHGYICRYDEEQDLLIPDMDRSQPSQCQFCQGSQLRHVKPDGSVEYLNGDRTKSRSNSTKCQCGYKHYWEGKEYDNVPEQIPISLEWGGKQIKDKVAWFQYESDPQCNSNVYEVASGLVQKHFPGEFGSERLVQKVVDTILHQTAVKEALLDPVAPNLDGNLLSVGGDVDASWRSDAASKIILTGAKKKTLHKEELTMSVSEREVKKKVEAKAQHIQKRKTDENSPREAHSSPPREARSKDSPSKHARTGSEDSGGPAVGSSPEGATVSPRHSDLPADMMRVRVTTSDGKQMTMTLAKEVSYIPLMDKLSTTLSVPINRLKVRWGFPPKLLTAPAEGSESKPIGIQNGDKLSVDLIPDKSQEAAPVAEDEKPHWSRFDMNAHDQSAQDMLPSLEHLHSGPTNSLDTSIGSLALLATLTGKDTWSYVQTMPHLFSVGGLYYEQVKRDLGLIDGKHCTLSSLPGKTFRFNAAEDRLELCLEPQGHFAVEPGIESKVLKTSQNPETSSSPSALPTTSLAKTLGSGSSGIVVNKPMVYPGSKSGTSTTAFTGHGHRLSAETANISMPQDLEMVPHHHHHHAHHQPPPEGTILEEPIATEMDTEVGTSREPVFRRIGPGTTVLDDSAANHINNQAEVFHNLVTEIEERFRECGDGEESSMDCADMNDVAAPPKESNMDTDCDQPPKSIDST